MKKQIQKLNTYELTLKNAERYIQVVASRFNIDEHFDDMLQVGRIALYDAFNRYNIESGHSFHSYAISFIRGRILTYINENVKIIRIPNHQLNTNSESYNPNNPVSIPTISTSTPIGDEGTTTLGDTLPADEQDNDVDDEQTFVSERLKQSLSKLKESHREIISMRYTLELNVEQIADKLNITKQAVSQQLKTAMKKLKNDFGVIDDSEYRSEIRITKKYQNNDYRKYDDKKK